MSLLKVGCLQLKLNKTDNLKYVVNAIEQTCFDHADLDLIVLASSDQEAESIAFKLIQRGATVDCTVVYINSTIFH